MDPARHDAADVGGLVQPDWDVCTDAQVCIVRRDAAGKTRYVAAAGGNCLTIGGITVDLNAEFVERTFD